VRESFQLTRLKPSERLLGDAAVTTAKSAVQLTMTLWVQELAVGGTIMASKDLRNDMMTMPSGLLLVERRRGLWLLGDGGWGRNGCLGHD
jgi:hypothetical protein